MSIRYRIRPGVVSAPVDGEITVLEPVGGVYFGLTDVGARVWELLQEARSLDGLVSQLVEEYEIDRASCMEDLTPLLEELTRRNLIEVA